MSRNGQSQTARAHERRIFTNAASSKKNGVDLALYHAHKKTHAHLYFHLGFEHECALVCT